MIVLTRLNDAQFAINPDLIERIHANPDTTLVMVDGSKYIVTESMQEVIDRIAAYRALVISMARDTPAPVRERPGLGLVPEVFSAEPSGVPTPSKTVPLRPRNN
ncbi:MULTISPECIES: flagellar FlbD family protein [unclassified Arthrobacter]|uniref:flagellar FlbD family protein n=1 Tax=unclassified Arthrobacter TaxID=235627 RepID=UPI001D13F480|nr:MULTISPECIES: flagellar FlbD family protein [unclassified Arthrobacter]MCC3276463.1 flagellar FlbD family protein [Arthrobacter sp. zg-Y20]MCC3280280.1 flagellar FlbD family protein [Arthrobacter sp. zg-Y40]MCC9178555.1 flagellar FlbD family protein [Arthrobacter sp. zg-Y750]MDK1316623.1 flagellar FlbD family protein [Arthrobacter sp. zg.Y20]MDK1328778.1 flagellar FlbD family protein [Arthrobacter sp. zg-Y1143]